MKKNVMLALLILILCMLTFNCLNNAAVATQHCIMLFTLSISLCAGIAIRE